MTASQPLQLPSLRRAAALARPAARGVAAAAWTAGMLGWARAESTVRPPAARSSAVDRLMTVWARGVMRLAGVELVRVGAPPPPTGRARLVIANHRTAMDIPVLLAHFPGSIVSRGDLAEWPVLGPAARMAQVIFVDQSSPASRIGALREIRAKLAQGRTVCVFPEGTTFAGDEVRPFYRGALAMGREIDVEVVPVGLAYPEGSEYVEDDFLAHVEKFSARRRVRVGMAIGSPERLDTSAQALERYREVVQGLVYDARRAVQRAGR